MSLQQEESLPADGFSKFWEVYPRREAKQAAAKAWARLRLERQATRIIEDVQARIADTGQWTDKKFIPMPATYLNNKRWQDEWTPATAKPAAGAVVRDARTDAEIEAANARELQRFGMAVQS